MPRATQAEHLATGITNLPAIVEQGCPDCQIAWAGHSELANERRDFLLVAKQAAKPMSETECSAMRHQR